MEGVSLNSSINGPIMKIKSDGYLDYTGFELPPEGIMFDFEKIDWKNWLVWAHTNWHYPIYAGVIYLTVIFGIQEYMKNRKAFELKKALFFWNAGLGLFSIIGFWRGFPESYALLTSENGFFNSVCVWKGASLPTAFWAIMFVLSKFVELGDTVFIVLRKRPLQLLQWYHHIVTLAVCWLTLPFMEPIARYYVVMNYGVHSLMYPYFAARALDIKVPKQLANLITTLQLSQMLVGLGVNTYSGIVYQFGGPGACFRHPLSVKMFFVVYGSFAVLFGELFYKLVIKPNANKKSAKTE